MDESPLWLQKKFRKKKTNTGPHSTRKGRNKSRPCWVSSSRRPNLARFVVAWEASELPANDAQAPG